MHDLLHRYNKEMPTDLHYLNTAKFGADYSGDNQLNSMSTIEHT